MAISRRALLISGGAAATVIIAGGVAISHLTPPLAPATTPWRYAGDGFADVRLNALSYAILAPNPHNRQPWQFELVGNDRIDVRCDLAKRLPHTDPFDRQITIGFGCMLELLSLAAAEAGYQARITPFPDGESQPRLDTRRIASVQLIPRGAVSSPLFAHILTRRSNKEPYAANIVDTATLGRVADGGNEIVQTGSTSVPATIADLIDIAWRGWMIEYETERTRKESIDLMRMGNAAVNASPDGIDLSGAFMGVTSALGLLNPEAMNEPGSFAYDSGIDMYRQIIGSAQGFVWLATAGNTRAEQIAAGREWVRTNLRAEADGMAIHPLSQVLQEFPEMADLYRELPQRLGVGDRTVQMFARVGYGPVPEPSPRWPLETKLIME